MPVPDADIFFEVMSAGSVILLCCRSPVSGSTAGTLKVSLYQTHQSLLLCQEIRSRLIEIGGSVRPRSETCVQRHEGIALRGCKGTFQPRGHPLLSALDVLVSVFCDVKDF